MFSKKINTKNDCTVPEMTRLEVYDKWLVKLMQNQRSYYSPGTIVCQA